MVGGTRQWLRVLSPYERCSLVSTKFTSSDLEQHHLYNDNQRAIEFVSQLSSLVIQSCARSNVLRKNQIHKHCINSALIVLRTTFRLDLFIKASFTSTVKSAFKRGNSLCSLVWSLWCGFLLSLFIFVDTLLLKSSIVGRANTTIIIACRIFIIIQALLNRSSIVISRIQPLSSLRWFKISKILVTIPIARTAPHRACNANFAFWVL